MNLLTKRTSWSGWEIGSIKLAVLAIALAVGSNWPQYFVPYTWPLVIVGVVAGLYAMTIWLRGLRR